MECKRKLNGSDLVGRIEGTSGVAEIRIFLEHEEFMRALSKQDMEARQRGEFSLSEREYVALGLWREVNRLQGNLRYYEGELAKLGPRAAKKRAERDLRSLLDGEGVMIEATVKNLKRQYEALVETAIRKGKKVPQAVVDQSEAFQQAKARRARYEKARRTSFANRTEGVDDSMQAVRGYKVKRQDGKPITEAQKAEIAAAVDELESVLGDLSDLFRRADLTIVHTSGKHVFLSQAAGQYNQTERSASVGWRSSVNQENVPQLAHEVVGHFLDDEAGAALGKKSRVFSTSHRMMETASLMAAERDACDPEASALLEKARASMNDAYGVKRKMAERLKAGDPKLSDTLRLRLERSKFILNPYWHQPNEIFARLAEQYLSKKLKKENPLSVYGNYAEEFGYWDDEAWAALEPQVERQIQRRLAILRKAAREQA